jgi:hypothetical protein
VRRLAVTVALVGAASLVRGSVARADEPARFEDATGFVWGLAVAEVGGMLSFVLAEELDVCSGCDEIGGIAAITVAVTAIGVGVGTQLADARADVPFIVHEAFAAFMSTGLLGAGMAQLGDGDVDEDAAGFMLGAFAGWSVGSYSFVRRDALLRDPDSTLGAHLMAWGPVAAMIVGGLAAAAADAEEEGVQVALGVSGLAAVVAGIAVAEIGLARGADAAGAGAPLVGFNGRF